MAKLWHISSKKLEHEEEPLWGKASSQSGSHASLSITGIYVSQSPHQQPSARVQAWENVFMKRVLAHLKTEKRIKERSKEHWEVVTNTRLEAKWTKVCIRSRPRNRAAQQPGQLESRQHSHFRQNRPSNSCGPLLPVLGTPCSTLHLSISNIRQWASQVSQGTEEEQKENKRWREGRVNEEGTAQHPSCQSIFYLFWNHVSF